MRTWHFLLGHGKASLGESGRLQQQNACTMMGRITSARTPDHTVEMLSRSARYLAHHAAN